MYAFVWEKKAAFLQAYHLQYIIQSGASSGAFRDKWV
jgi:phosphorylcholine metabolism protein LicD